MIMQKKRPKGRFFLYNPSRFCYNPTNKKTHLEVMPC